jgi:predicted transcriptional regulator
VTTEMATKWGRPIAERGFAQLPNYLLFINQFLDKDHRLSPVELLVLFQLVGTWWKKGDLPFPSMGTLAVRCGVSDRQIQRAVNQLEKIGLISRVKRRIKGIISSNAYDLAPLVSILEEIAKTFPNEFPRNVDKTIVREISKRLDAHAAQNASQTVAPAKASFPATKFEVLPYKSMEGYYIRATWPDGRVQNIDDNTKAEPAFKTEAEAEVWIEDKSAGWLQNLSSRQR